jgi:hypothetical protein
MRRRSRAGSTVRRAWCGNTLPTARRAIAVDGGCRGGLGRFSDNDQVAFSSAAPAGAGTEVPDLTDAQHEGLMRLCKAMLSEAAIKGQAQLPGAGRHQEGR